MIVSVSKVAILVFLDGAWRCELPALAASGHFHALLTLSSLCSGQAPGDQRQAPLTLRKHGVRALGPRNRRASNKEGSREKSLSLIVN